MSTSATLPAASSVVREVPLRQDATVIGLVGLAHASSHFGHLLLPLLFPVFMKEFGLSFAELGFLMTVFFVVSGTGQATAGFVVDRIMEAYPGRQGRGGVLGRTARRNNRQECGEQRGPKNAHGSNLTAFHTRSPYDT